MIMMLGPFPAGQKKAVESSHYVGNLSTITKLTRPVSSIRQRSPGWGIVPWAVVVVRLHISDQKKF